ncbi:collagen-like protein [Loigolactobacillus backii]|uniref:collagen-like protein n=1 Tax=Loigolactobacillus backii TaxID=375175 RepID=UPI0007F18668|nr:collagen-like protein [Loigolactobacillus backii]ANK59807.1 hypothetical protein AYR52_05760 [Loigolactobacillus backii]
MSNTSQADQAAELQTADQSSAAVTTHMQYVKNTSGTVFWPVTSWDAIIGLDGHIGDADVIKNIQQGAQGVKGDTGPTGPQGPQGPAGNESASMIIDNGDSTTNGRAVNCPPSYYQTNYPAKEVRELKQTSSFGVTLPSGQASTYGILTTKVAGNNTDFGRPRQEFETTGSTRPWTYIRIGTSDTTWSDWELITTW